MQNLINLDQKVFDWFNSFIYKNNAVDFLIKIFAVYFIYLIPLTFIIFWFLYRNEKTQKFLLELFFVLIVSWQVVARIIGMIINRPRPSTFEGAKEILFHPPTYAFPSDHALFLAALTTYLYLAGYKKIGNIALILTILISVSRIIAGFHWPGDVLAGWILGTILAFIFYKIRKPIEKNIISPIYKLTKMLHIN